MGRRNEMQSGGEHRTNKPVPLVEIADDRRVLIEHHHGLLAYSCELIVIRVRFGLIRITGKKLWVATMSREQLVICGQIDGICLERTGRNCDAG